MISKNFILLKKIKYSESDLIVYGISQEGEKLSFIAKGALKSKKRFSGGVLDPMHYVQLTYKEPRSAEGLRWVQEAKLIRGFDKIRTSYDRLELAWKIIECIYFVSQEGDQNSQLLFNLLGNTLKAVEEAENLELLKMHFFLKFLYQQGVIQPEKWMGEFLRVPVKEGAELLQTLFKENQHRLPYLERQIKNYLNSAEI